MIVVIDDHSGFTKKMFLTTKDETYEVLITFFKHVQIKLTTRLLNSNMIKKLDLRTHKLNDSVLNIELVITSLPQLRRNMVSSIHI